MSGKSSMEGVCVFGEGILTRCFCLTALESAHAIHGALVLAKSLPKDQDIVVCLSGRGDKVRRWFSLLACFDRSLT